MIFEESETIEFKFEMIADIEKLIIASLNTKGGTIYIGVNDDGGIIGVPKDKRDEYDLHIGDLITETIKPNSRGFISYEYDENNVLVINIKEGSKKPYYLVKKGPKPSGVFIRVGRSIRSASDEEILEMIRVSSGWLWEKEVSSNQNLHFSMLKIYFERKDIEFDESDYLTLGIKNLDNKFTNLGLLVSDENPIEVKFACYDMELDFKFKKEYTGSIINITDEVLRRADSFNITTAKIPVRGGVRLETMSFPGKSMRESVLNAICHARYDFPSNIKIEFFYDHAQISNPGSVYKYSLDEVLKGQQSFRNPGLVRILFKLGFIENYGKGLKRIINAYKNEKVKPELLNMANCFIVNLPDLNYVYGNYDTQNLNINDNEKLGEKFENLNIIQKSIIQYINQNSKITYKQMAVEICTSEETIRKNIKFLVSENIIRRIGSAKGGYWEIIDNDNN